MPGAVTVTDDLHLHFSSKARLTGVEGSFAFAEATDTTMPCHLAIEENNQHLSIRITLSCFVVVVVVVVVEEQNNSIAQKKGENRATSLQLMHNNRVKEDITVCHADITTYYLFYC